VAEAIAFAESLGLEPVVELGTRHADPPLHREPDRPRRRPTPIPHPPPELGEHDGADWLPRT
jgi:hypothetical protein